MTAQLYDREAPNTVRNFINLARGAQPWLDPKTRKMVQKPLYENLLFHRVIPDFMIQTGDPTGTGAHNCGYTIKDEVSPVLKFDRPGRLGMANIGQPNTGACQFFITEAPYPAGNGGYTIFGQIVDGQNVVGKIAHVIRDSNDKPRFPVKLISVQIMRVAAAPDLRTPAATGNGVFVNSSGDILTEYQVVQGCSEIHLPDGSKVALAASDRTNDLALLHSGKRPESVALFSEEAKVGVGSGAGIKGSTAMGFLEASGVNYKTGDASLADPVPYTVEIQCFK